MLKLCNDLLILFICLRDAAIKQKLERAIREMESPKKPPTTSIPRGLRRSISMSEITPSGKYTIKMLV